MKKIFLISFLLVLIVACKEPHKTREMGAMEVMGQLNNDFAVLVDIREKDDVKTLAEPARWIPLSVIEENQNNLTKIIDDKYRNRLLVLYSETPEKSMQTCKIFVDINIKCNYMKNFADWENNKLPTRMVSE